MDPEGPTEPEPVRPRLPWGWRGAIWLAFVLLWTTGLLMPMTQETTKYLPWVAAHKVVIGKSLHVLSYALLAILSGWLRVPCRFRWILLFLIMAHATATELLQRFIEGRTGTLVDVGLDHLGIALGLLVTWRWWSDPC
jgi:VanZ family protein